MWSERRRSYRRRFLSVYSEALISSKRECITSNRNRNNPVWSKSWSDLRSDVMWLWVNPADNPDQDRDTWVRRAGQRQRFRDTNSECHKHSETVLFGEKWDDQIWWVDECFWVWGQALMFLSIQTLCSDSLCSFQRCGMCSLTVTHSFSLCHHDDETWRF